MGKAGPAGKPTALRLIQGEQKKNPGRINRDEPIPGEIEVKPPPWLSPKARKIWKHLAPDLIAKRVLTGWDIEAFASYCDAIVRRAEASRRLAKEGQVVTVPVFNKKTGEKTGERETRSPWVTVQRDADMQVQRWGARFGLTPSERSQIKLPQGGSGKDDLLS